MGNAQYYIVQGQAAVLPHYGALAYGFLKTGAVIFLRARFYWWPVHPIGLLIQDNWFAHRIWLPFFLGWLCKVSIMKLGGGRQLKAARNFFIAFVVVEGFFGCLSALVRWTGEVFWNVTVPGF